MNYEKSNAVYCISAWVGIIIALLLFWWVVLSAIGCKPEPLQKNDRIVFIGNSITASGLWTDGWLTQVNERIQERYSNLGVLVIGSGIAGNTSINVLERMDGILAITPTVSVLFIGTNDCWRTVIGDGTPIPKFDSVVRDIVRQLKKTSRVIICTPCTIGEKHGGIALLDEYSNILIKIAVDEKVQLINLRHEFKKRLKDNELDTGVLTIDGVHPNKAGSKLIADKILEGLVS